MVLIKSRSTAARGDALSYPGPVPRFSANLHFLFGEHPFLDRFAAAAQAGFSAVEFPDPYAHPLPELAARLRAHALQCVLLNLPMGDRANGEMGIACLPDRRDEFRAGLARAIEAARALDCPRLNCMAGRQPAGADPRRLRDTLVENLRLAAEACAGAGLEVTLEPLNTTDIPDIFVRGSQQAIDLIEAAGAPNLRLQFDCYHLQLMEGALESSLERLLPRIGHIQIGDVPGRHEPGTGGIPYPRIFALLDRLGYSGWVGAEYHPSQRTDLTFGWMPAGR
jgi:hydroxypyruvate isomerase